MSVFTPRDECGMLADEREHVQMRIRYPERGSVDDWTRAELLRRPYELENIRRSYEQSIASYRCSAEQTYSGQDMSSYQRERPPL